MITPIFTDELTLKDPKYFQDVLSKRIKDMLILRVPKENQAWQSLNQLFEQQVGLRPAILHPDIFYWLENSRQKKEVSSKDLAELSEVAKGVTNSIEQAVKSKRDLELAIDVGNQSMRVADRLKRAEIAAVDSGARISLSVIPCDMALLKSAITLLKEKSPAKTCEIERFITNIVMFEGKTVIGFTDFHNHGAIFIKYDMVKDNPVFLAEEIVHESSHTVLNTIMVADPLVKNPKDERYQTPLRKDERPMFGLFHQLYVLSNLNRFYDNIDAGDKHAERKLAIKEKLDAAFKTVKTHADFTVLGERIFLELEGFYS